MHPSLPGCFDCIPFPAASWVMHNHLLRPSSQIGFCSLRSFSDVHVSQTIVEFCYLMAKKTLPRIILIASNYWQANKGRVNTTPTHPQQVLRKDSPSHRKHLTSGCDLHTLDNLYCDKYKIIPSHGSSPMSHQSMWLLNKQMLILKSLGHWQINNYWVTYDTQKVYNSIEICSISKLLKSWANMPICFLNKKSKEVSHSKSARNKR